MASARTIRRRLGTQMAASWRRALTWTPETIARKLLERAGITIGGTAPWDIQVHNEALYARVMRDGHLGLGEAYMDGWWDCDAVDQFLTRLHRSGVREQAGLNVPLVLQTLRYRLLNPQTVRGRRKIIGHYSLSAELFEAMLDPYMQYTCGYWRGAETLEQAQEDKLELICRKAGLRPGATLLDLGCGWGGLLRYGAEHHGISGTGVNITRPQVEYARRVAAGLPLEFVVQDYRLAEGQFDAVTSICMIEHVGLANLPTYFEVVDRCLEPDGVFVLQFIAGMESGSTLDPWLERYIFNNAFIPSLAQMIEASEGRFVVEDVHSFGTDYDPTLMAWLERFDAAWPELRAAYDERFRRMWRYYLMMCAAAHRARFTGLYQLVFRRAGSDATHADWHDRSPATS